MKTTAASANTPEAEVMAALRNLAISLLRRAGATHLAPALRACSRDRLRPLRLIGLAMA